MLPSPWDKLSMISQKCAPATPNLLVSSSVLPLVCLMESAALSPFVAGPKYSKGLTSLSLPSPPKLPVWTQAPTCLLQEAIYGCHWIPGCGWSLDYCSWWLLGFLFTVTPLLHCHHFPVSGGLQVRPAYCLTTIFSCNLLPVLHPVNDSLSSQKCLHPILPSWFSFFFPLFTWANEFSIIHKKMLNLCLHKQTKVLISCLLKYLWAMLWLFSQRSWAFSERGSWIN